MEILEAKILELSAKGIRPSDIAKIYDLNRKDVLGLIFADRKRKEEAARKKSAIEKIIAIAKIEEAAAEKVLAAVREVLNE